VNRRSFLLLALLTCFAAIADWAQSTTNAPLSFKLLSIHVQGLSHFKEDQIVKLSGLRLGENAVEKDFQQAVQKLGDTGMFNDVAYAYHYSSSGCDLELRVTENDRLVPIRFDNFVWFSDDDLIAQLRSRVPLFDGKLPLRGNLADQIAEALNGVLTEHKITGRAEYIQSGAQNGPIDSYTYAVKFHPVIIRNMDFPGAAAAELPALQAAAKPLAGQEYLRSTVRPHEKLDFLPIYLSRGYLKAEFSDAQANVAADGPRTLVNVKFPVKPGVQYRVAQVRWTGVQAISVQQLQGLIHLNIGAPANAVQLQNDLEGVRKLYGTTGYLTANVKSAATLDDSAATVAYELAVVEGDQFRMGELQIDGIDANAASKLAAQWQLKRGDVFDDSYLRRFFQIMYHDIGLSQSYSVVPKRHVNQQEKTVDIALHFVPKK
jgi:outer membrane protein assembly factor BamA